MSNVVEANAANWERKVLDAQKLVLVEFWHPRCPYCSILAPVYVALAEEYAGKLEFARVNVLESPANQELAVRYGIMGTPTLKFFCQGRPVQELVGVMSKQKLQQDIEFAVEKHRECAANSTPLNLSDMG
jgi:thioredoxin 1